MSSSSSMYRFVKDSKSSSGSKRLFLQGTTDRADNSGAMVPGGAMGPAIVTNLYHPNELDNVPITQRTKTEVLGSSIESTKTTRKDELGRKRITTRIVKKVQTISRGEEKSVTEDMTKRSHSRSLESREMITREVRGGKKAKVRTPTRFLKGWLAKLFTPHLSSFQ